MIRNIAALFWIIFVGTAVAHAHEDGHGHDAHEHGIARLDIAMDGGTVQLDLDSPAVNLIGFEHEPGNVEEQATLDRAVADLKRGDELIIFTPAARCTQKRVLVESGLLDHSDEVEHGHKHKGEAGEHNHEHADVTVFWEVDCASANALREIDFRGLFRRFPDMLRLRVQAVLPGGQTSVELAPGNAVLRLSQ